MPRDSGVSRLWDIHTLNELRRQMKNEPLSRHHRLPGSRGGRYPKPKDHHRRKLNLIDINDSRHGCWHVLVYNKIATEVAVQFNMWWVREQIFRNYPRQKFECHHVLPETVGKRTRWLCKKVYVPADTMDMSRDQDEAFANLFGPNTSPEIACVIMNEFLVHPETPLLIVPHSRT